MYKDTDINNEPLVGTLEGDQQGLNNNNESVKDPQGNPADVAGTNGNASNEAEADNPTSLNIEKFRDYSLTELTVAGYIIARLVANRNIDPKIIKQKIDSILKLGGLAQCIIVVDALKCLNEGLEVEIITEGDAPNIKVTKDYPGLEKILVSIDGNHRLAAILEINKDIEAQNAKPENEKNQKPIMEAYIKLPLIDAPISDFLREANIATTVWKSSDYIRHLAVTQEADGEEGICQWTSKEISSDRTGSERALWYFASFSKDRTPSNIKLSAAAKDSAKYKSLADAKNFKCGKKVYNLLNGLFGIDFVRTDAVALYIVGLKDKVIAGDTSLEQFVVDFKEVLGNYSEDDSLIKDTIILTKTVTVKDKKGEIVTKQFKLKKDERTEKYLDALDKIILKHKPEWYKLIKG